MALISSCPSCSKQVSVPNADPASLVRCPLCGAEFSLQAVLDLTPPMLEILPARAEEQVMLPMADEIELPAADEITFGATDELEAPAADDIELPATDEIDFSATGALDLPIEFDSPAEPSRAGSFDSFSSASEEMTFDAQFVSEVELEDDEPDTEVEEKQPSFDDFLAEPAMKPAAALQGEFGDDELTFSETELDSPFEMNEAIVARETSPHIQRNDPGFAEVVEAPSTAVVLPLVKRRRRESSFLGNLVGIVGGGLVAIPLALLIVIWIKGPSGDFAGIAPYLPSWALPSSFNEPKTAAIPPMSPNPTSEDLDDIRKAGGLSKEPIKLDTTEPPKAAEDSEANMPDPTESANSGTTENPAPTTTESPDTTAPDAAADLADDLAKDVPPIAPAVPVEQAPPAPAPTDSADSVEPAPAGDEAKPVDPVTAEPPAKPSVDEFSNETIEDHPVILVGPKNPPKYTATEVDKVIGELKQLRAAYLDAPSDDTKAKGSARGPYYRKLFELGEVVTFAADAGPTAGAAAEFLTELGDDENNLKEIGDMSMRWWNAPAAKRNNNGILIAGSVEQIAKSGDMFRIQVATGSDKTVNVYAPTKPDLSEGSKVLVLGSIIDNPKEILQNFTDEDAPVVWHGLSVKAGK
jgi:hypothetical protein